VKKSVVILLNLGYWVMYLFLLFVFFVLAVASDIATGMDFKGALWNYFEFMIFLAVAPGLIAFYLGYIFLFNRFLSKRKILSFFIGLIVSMVLASVSALFLMWVLYPTDSFDLFSTESIIAQLILMSFVALVNLIIGVVLKGFIISYGDISIKEELTRKNTDIELSLVKSQLNPHFLFNTINNIDILIGIDANRASQYLNKLSDIMRFMLYETKSEMIPVSKEIEYITKYIELQKIRTSIPNYVNFIVNKHDNDFMITPMVFIPFVENAFKHSEDRKEENAIRINIVASDSFVLFECSNFFRINESENGSDSGLGNDLIKRRLELLYPNNHELSMEEEGEIFHVKLKITK
jgi:two-component system LytT family sensor kinase